MATSEEGRAGSNEQDGSAKKPAGQKRPYVKPSFEWEQAFETMALACGKINVTQAQCKFNRKNS